MIAPEPRGGIHTRLRVLLRNNLLASALIFALLECWRPYFFLTDDNLDGTFPFFVEVGRNILSGHSPFISHQLFGGGYNFLRDPAFFDWHPFYLLTSLLAGTPFRNAIVDTDAFMLMMLATAGFTVLAHHLRDEGMIKLSDGWIMFFALSYTYTMIALTTGASWLTFLGDHSALPWLALGILQKRWTRGVLITVIFVVHQTLGGHLAPTTSNSIFLSLFALGTAISRRSILPLVNWLAGYAIAVAIVSPLLIPMLGGFNASMRAGGDVLTDMQNNNIPAVDLSLSLFIGMALWLIHPGMHPHVTYTLAFSSSAAAWCLIPALFSRARWRGAEVVPLVMMIFGAVLICRPEWITKIMMHLPLFKSMRWPFRELLQFQFFMHLFLLVRTPGFREELRILTARFSALIFVVPLVLYTLPPTLNAMNWDRELVLTGGVERFWAQVRPLLKPDDRIAVLIPLDLYTDDRFEEPYSVLGTYNYAVLGGVINAWGYSPTVPLDQTYTKTYAYYPYGAYLPGQRAALMAERPDLKFITLESLRPLKITLSWKDGATMQSKDLTPYVPKRISKDPGPPPPE